MNAYNNDYDPAKIISDRKTFTTEVNNINISPLFVDEANNDFHLSPNSPLINKGLNSAPSIPAADYEGNQRIIGGIVDIGANEYNPVRASFTASPTIGTAPLAVVFQDKSISLGASIVSWEWDFNNDSIIDSNIQNPSHIYTDIGTYKVNLSVTDSSGNKDTKSGYIVVDYDIDGDGVFNTLDNCPKVYNPGQVDLDNNGIGDACDSNVDLLAEVPWGIGLKSATATEYNAYDHAGVVKNGDLTGGLRVQLKSGQYDVLGFRSNTEARKLSTIILNIYISGLYNGVPQNAKVYAYNADGISVKSTSSLFFTLSSGWNRLNLTSLLHSMDGFGFIKFRVAAAKNWFDISEAYYTELVDNWQIGVNPGRINFGAVEAGKFSTMNLTVSNTGSGNLIIKGISVPSAPFSLASDGCSGITLAASATCPVSIKFAPTVAGTFTGVLRMLSNDADNPSTAVSLSGTGTLPSNTLTGIVTDGSTAAPLSNVNVTVTDSLGTHTAATDANGTYTIISVADGSFAATFEKSGYSTRSINGTKTPGQIYILNVQLSQIIIGTISGNVTDSETNAAISLAMVTITDSQSVVQTVYTDANGYYMIPNVAQGHYNGSIAAQDYSTFMFTGSMTAGQTMTVNGAITLQSPVVSSITIPSANTNSATITWATDQQTSSIFEYGVNTSYGSTVSDPALRMNHTTALSGLTQGTTYHYRITSTNSHSLSTVSPDNTFTTPIPPVMTSVTITALTTASASITWTTDQPADSLVSYGATAAYGFSSANATLTQSHSITLANLTEQTMYHLMITSKNSAGLSSSSMDMTFWTRSSAFTTTTLEEIGNVTVMEVSGNYDAKNPNGTANNLPRQEIAKEFYRTHPDNYDFLAIITNFDFAMLDTETFAFYSDIKNDTSGIGLPLFDASNLYGSNSKLQGMIDMGYVAFLGLSPFDPYLFNYAVDTLAHEQLHRWSAHVKFKNPDGTFNTGLLGKAGSHWSYLLDTDGSLEYGNDWRNNGDGTFTSVNIRSYYNALDLYLMGMIDKSEVLPMTLIENTGIDPTLYPQLGATITGMAKTVTIDDIIAAEGDRVPAVSTSQKSFKIGYILITRPGTFTGSETAGIEHLRNAYAWEFASLTGGKGYVGDATSSLSAMIASPSNNATISAPDITVTGIIVNTVGNETAVTVNGIVASVSGNQFAAAHVPVVEGANTITVTVTDSGARTATSTVTVNKATTGNYIRVTSNIESGTAPLEATLRVDGSFSIANTSIDPYGPAVPEITKIGADEYKVKMTTEGAYTFAIRSTGPDGNAYQDSATIIVVNKNQIDALLKAKWEGMKTKLASQDVTSAVSYFNSSSQQLYNDLFTALNAQVPQLVQEMQDIQLIYIRNGTAKYRIIKNEIYGGQPLAITYYIYFAIDESGMWKIAKF